MKKDSETERALGIQRLQFFGRIVGSVSHEINNVVTIISEVAGLLGDMTAMAEQGRPLPPAKLKKQYDRIERQVERGKIIVKRLNEFTHTLDRWEQTFGLQTAVENMVGLTRRLADMRGAELCVENRADEGLCIQTSRFSFQHLLFLVVDAALSSNDTDVGSIQVSMENSCDSVSVHVSWPKNDRAFGEDALQAAQQVADDLGAELDTNREQEGRVEVTLRLPARAR